MSMVVANETKAKHNPGGRKVHQASCNNAELFDAQNNMVPQETAFTFSNPRKARPASAAMA